jgi:hypothetical protein
MNDLAEVRGRNMPNPYQFNVYRGKTMMRTFIIAAASAATLSVPTTTFAQQGQSAATIPDLSGVWARPYLGVEPPLSGPGPVMNTARQRQTLDGDGKPLPAATAPLVSTFRQFVGDYTNPILKPHAAAAVKKHGEMESSGLQMRSARNQCWPEGVPAVFYDIGIQMLQQPDKIIIVYDFDHEFRQVRLNQSHPAQVKPSWYGDSVGHFDGDTLVIDTVGIKIGPFSMADPFGTPFTQALHVVERYRLVDYEAAREAQERGLTEHVNLRGGGDSGLAVDFNYKGKGLQLEFTVEDEGVFTTSWSATVTYRRALNIMPENVCAENTYEAYGARTLPTADKPDF